MSYFQTDDSVKQIIEVHCSNPNQVQRRSSSPVPYTRLYTIIMCWNILTFNCQVKRVRKSMFILYDNKIISMLDDNGCVHHEIGGFRRCCPWLSLTTSAPYQERCYPTLLWYCWRPKGESWVKSWWFGCYGYPSRSKVTPVKLTMTMIWAFYPKILSFIKCVLIQR